MARRLAEWLLRGILASYPDAVRDEYRGEMLATCRARRAALGRAAPWVAAWFWAREYAGVLRGAVTAHREVRRLADHRTAHGRVEAWSRAVRLAVRQCGRRPTLFGTSMVVLALGIGANGALGGMGWTVLAGPLPFAEPDRLLRLFHNDDLSFGVSFNELQYYRTTAQSFDDLAGWRVHDATYLAPSGPVRIIAGQVTPNFFAVLGRVPMLGRALTETGDRAEVLLSHRFWMTRLGADSSAIGTRIRIDDTPRTIVGILPDDLVFPDPTIDYFHPIDVTAPRPPGRGGLFLDVIGRLGRTADPAAAAVEADILAVALRRANPAAYDAEPNFGAYLQPMRESLFAGHRSLVVALVAGAALVLLATSLNVATLLLSHVEGGSVAVAIRRALGASPMDIVRIHAAEGMVIAAGGALGGVLVAWWSRGLLGRFVPVQLVGGPGGDPVALLGAVLVGALVTAVVFALAPTPIVLRYARPLTTRSATPPTSRVGTSMRLAQSSVALILVAGALLLFESARKTAAVDLGYRTDETMTARITLPAARYPDAEADVFFRDLAGRIRTDGRVRGVGVVNALPLSATGGSGDVYLESIDPDSAIDVVAHRLASPEYFTTLGIPSRAGRSFAPTDRAGTPRVAVVDETFARQFFGSPAEAVGQRLRSFFGGEEWNEIVGVVGDVKHGGPREATRPHVYYPVAQRPTRGAYVVARVHGDLPGVGQFIREAARELDPTLPVYDVQSMEARLRASQARGRFVLLLFGAFAALALTLASIGTYGTVRLAQQRRTREMGIRRALGASARNVVWNMTRNVAWTMTGGAFLGLAGAWVVGSVLQNLLFGVSFRDPRIMAVATIVLLASGTMAAILPAAAAARGELGRVLGGD